MTDEELAQSIMKTADTDNDGKLSKDELLEMVKADHVGDDLVVKQNRHEAIAHIIKEFDGVDANVDGKLGVLELVKLILSYEDRRKSRVEETARELLTDGDTDKD